MILSRSEQLIAKAILENGIEVDLVESQELLGIDGVGVITVSELLEDFRKANLPGVLVGPISWHVMFGSPLAIDLNNERRSIFSLVISGVRRSFQYTINPMLARGHVLRDVLQDKEIYKELITEGFDWRKLVESQLGHELTVGEVEALSHGSR